MATDSYKMSQNCDTTLSPARNAVPITPSDSADFPLVCKAIYVGGGGDIALMPQDGATAVVFKAVPQGSLLPVRASRVLATGTTATLLVALL